MKLCLVGLLLIEVVIYFDDVIQVDLENTGSKRGIQSVLRLGIRPTHLVIPTPDCIPDSAEPVDPGAFIEADNGATAVHRFDLAQLPCLHPSRLLEPHEPVSLIRDLPHPYVPALHRPAGEYPG